MEEDTSSSPQIIEDNGDIQIAIPGIPLLEQSQSKNIEDDMPTLISHPSPPRQDVSLIRAELSRLAIEKKILLEKLSQNETRTNQLLQSVLQGL